MAPHTHYKHSHLHNVILAGREKEDEQRDFSRLRRRFRRHCHSIHLVGIV